MGLSLSQYRRLLSAVVFCMGPLAAATNIAPPPATFITPTLCPRFGVVPLSRRLIYRRRRRFQWSSRTGGGRLGWASATTSSVRASYGRQTSQELARFFSMRGLCVCVFVMHSIFGVVRYLDCLQSSKHFGQGIWGDESMKPTTCHGEPESLECKYMEHVAGKGGKLGKGASNLMICSIQ